MLASPNRIIWITGSSSGIGRALAERFASNGDIVVLSGRRRSRLERVQKGIRAGGRDAIVVECDVRQEDSVNQAVRTIQRSVGAIDILVNNAGVSVFKEFVGTSVKEFDNIVGTNLRGSFLATKAVLPSMVRRARGVILNIVSFAARTTYTESSVYAASKAGMTALMEGLRAEVRSKGVKVVNVFPGAVRTPIWPSHVSKKHGRSMMTPEELALMVVAVANQPPSMMVEELVLRPQEGDINA
jgi:NADP-dependent 3-hydroxy acid dehydrogenase YdfG